VRLYNRTPLPQTFLWWANPAVHVDENHQSVFPPDVTAVMDHGRRDVSTFPIATGTYYKVDYSPGTDISRYKNVPVPTSYMADHSDFDFVASYDHGRRAGLLHVADHHVSPGKKQWTWGCGDFGKAWDRQLTDEDGPYVELMCGVFTDNQPDFSWLAPYDERQFKQYYMPYKRIGRINNATIEAAINLEVEGDEAYAAAYVTSPQQRLRLVLRDASGNCLLDDRGVELSPEEALERTITLPPAQNRNGLSLSLLDARGREIVSYTQRKYEAATPSPATAAPPPEEMTSNEQLFLAGVHLEQYRHATRSPEAYYREALRRDPSDARNNNALGLLMYRRGLFAEAERHLRRAVATWAARNPNPRDAEPLYNLGLALKMQGRFAEAFDAFARSVWRAAQQPAGYFSMAQIASIQGHREEAIDLADRALAVGANNHKARVLKAALLRMSGRRDDALREAAIVHATDPLDFGALNELCELGSITSAELSDAMRGEEHNFIELSLDYAAAGLYATALSVLGGLPQAKSVSPIPDYIAGWISMMSGDSFAAAEFFRAAAKHSPRLCFPNRLEEMLALQAALQAHPDDGQAAYLLGNLLYSKGVYKAAIEAWETSARSSSCNDFPTVHRNLALAYFNKRGDATAARASLEKAFELDPTDARVLFELDQLYRKINRPPGARLALLEKHETLTRDRDDLYLEGINLLLLHAEFERAQQLLRARHFHPWEGGEGRVSGAHVASLLGSARELLWNDKYADALALLEAARTYPPNLGEGKLPGALENDLDYFAGVALRALSREKEAREYFERATRGLDEPVSAVYYNDQPPHMIFYQGLALNELGRAAEARQRFDRLIVYGREHLSDSPTIDYFAVSLPEFLIFEDDLERRNRVHCHYMMALGHMGLGQWDSARAALDAVRHEDAAHLGAAMHLRMLERMSKHSASERM
jgi:tetratricopeptide (TPR) repeat protein